MYKLTIPYSALNNRGTSVLVSASNTRMINLGSVVLDVSMQGLFVPIEFCVLRNMTISCILGANFLQESRGILDCGQKVLSLFDGLVIAPLICNFDRDSILLLSHAVTIPPHCEALVPVKVHSKYKSQTLIVEGWPSLKDRFL